MLNNKREKNLGFFPKNQKAQIGETVTWIVATLIIIFILVTFIFAASLMGKAKSIASKKIALKTSSGVTETSWVEVKTIFAFEKNINNKNEIDSWIKGVEK